MPPNVKSVVEEPDRIGWPDDHGASSSSFIDLDISLDVLTRVKDHGRHSLSSGRPKCKDLRNGNAWGEANELQSNLHIEVGDRSFHLYRFPLISRSGRLNRLVFELRDPGKDRIALHDVPGGAEAFEVAVRYLYGGSGNVVELSETIVAALRCAAEYLEMDDRLGEGSLVAKTELYLNTVVMGSWKYSIAALRSCSADLEPWAEELEIVRRCSESVAWKASTDPLGLRWSDAMKGSSDRNGRIDWWFDDVCSLPINAFTRVINAVVAKGMDSATVAAVVTQYAENWLTKFVVADLNGKNGGVSRDRAVVHGIVSLLPLQAPGAGIPFTVLLKLLRVACAANAGALCKTDLARRIGAQLEKVALAGELLIPAYGAASDAVMYDIDVVHKIVDYYLQEQSSAGSPTKVTRPSTTTVSSATIASSPSDSGLNPIGGPSATATTEKMSSSEDQGRAKLDSRFKEAEFFASDTEPTRRSQLPPTSSNLKVAHLLESLLMEVAKDSTIPVGKFVALADLFVDFPRESDDGVYRAVDTFLRSHPSLICQERRRLCKVMDVHALSQNACKHAAANERLPLRVVVQVLFLEQAKLRNVVVETPAAVTDKGVDSIAASFASWNSAYSVDSSTSTPRLSTSTGTATPSSAASACGLRSAAAPLMPGGLTVADTLRCALSEIDLLRTAVQEIDTVKARLNSMDHTIQLEVENINRKILDLAAHEYGTSTHQGEEATKGAKQKGGWASGWKKMAKPFQHGKDHPGCANNGLMSDQRHVMKGGGDTMSTSTYQQMSILHPTDVPFLQCSKQPGVQGAGAKFAAPDQAAPIRTVALANGETGPVRVMVMPKVEPDLAIDVASTCQFETAQLKVEYSAAEALPGTANVGPEHDYGVCSEENSYQPPRPSVAEEQPARHGGNSKDEPARQSVSKKNGAAHPRHRRHHHEHGGVHQPRSQHCPRTHSPHDRRSDAVSESSHHSYSSGHSNTRHRHRDSSSSHRSENRSHHSSSRGHGRAHKSSRHRHANRSRSHSPDGAHHRRSHYSPDHYSHHSRDPPRASSASKHGSDHFHSSDHHHHHSKDPPRASSAAKHPSTDRDHSDHHHHLHTRDPPRASFATKHGMSGHHSSDHHYHHQGRDPPRTSSAANSDINPSDHHHHHLNSKDPPRASSAGSHKTGSDHHFAHQRKSHHGSSHQNHHHHTEDYDSASSCSSDSGPERTTRLRR